MASREPDAPGRLALAFALAAAMAVGAVGAQEADVPVESPPIGETAPAPTPSTASAGVDIRVQELGVVESRTAALLLSGQTGGNLPGVMLWCAEPVADDDGKVPVRLFVELDGGTLLAASKDGRIPLAVFAYALDDNGRIVGHHAHGALVEGPGVRSLVSPGGLRFVGRMALPPGTISLRLMARLYGTDTFFLTRQEIHLAVPGSGEAAMSAPLFAARDGAWLEVLQQGVERAAGCAESLVPAAMPVLDLTRPMDFSVTAADWPEDARLALSVMDIQGRVLDDPVLGLGAPRAIADSAVEIHPAQIPPFDVPPGEYRLLLRLLGPTGEELVNRPIPVVLLPLAAPASWAGLDELARGELEPPPPVVTDEELSDRELRRAYIEALRLLADGDPVGARRAVTALERGAFASQSSKGLLALRRVETKLAGQIARRVPKALPPVVLLHRDLYRTYSAYRESALASHSWLLAAELAEAVGLEVRWPPPEGFAEGVLVSLATDVVQSAAPVTGAELLERAVALNPSFAPALLGLAALRERSGQRSDAIDTLQRLVAADPGNSEGRLRLGVNLARVGRRGAAEKVLRALALDSPPEWVLSIAAEEMARLLVADRRLPQAETVLRDAIGRVSNHQRLLIELAWVLDLAGRSREGADALAQVEAAAGRRYDSARMRYSQWPEMGLYEIRAELRRVGDERLPDLREALESKEFR